MDVLINDDNSHRRKYTTSTSFNISASTACISLREFSNYYQLKVCMANTVDTLKVWVSGTSTAPTYYWYYDTSSSVTSIQINSDNSNVFHFTRNDASQYVSSTVNLYKNIYNITFE